MSLKEFRRDSLKDKLDKTKKVELTEEAPDKEAEVQKGRVKKSGKRK